MMAFMCLTCCRCLASFGIAAFFHVLEIRAVNSDESFKDFQEHSTTRGQPPI